MTLPYRCKLPSGTPLSLVASVGVCKNLSGGTAIASKLQRPPVGAARANISAQQALRYRWPATAAEGVARATAIHPNHM